MSSQLEIFQQARTAVVENATAEASKVPQLQQMVILGQINSKDLAFANSLLNAANSGRGATAKQIDWIIRLVERYLPKPKAPIANVGSVLGVVELLKRARDRGLKFPKLWLKLPGDLDLRISVSGPNSCNPGYLSLSDGGPFGNNRYFGKVSPSGELRVNPAESAVEGPLRSLLERLAAEPAKVAAEFGHLTGHCCFCSKKLKDDRSTEVGYGRTCAKKYGMPWGAK